jgi:acetate kinase
MCKSRTEILRGLESCGVVLDAAANEAGGDESPAGEQRGFQVAVWVVTAQEDRMIAVHVGQMEATTVRRNMSNVETLPRAAAGIRAVDRR